MHHVQTTFRGTCSDTILDNSWICNEQRIEFENTLIWSSRRQHEWIHTRAPPNRLQSNHRNPRPLPHSSRGNVIHANQVKLFCDYITMQWYLFVNHIEYQHYCSPQCIGRLSKCIEGMPAPAIVGFPDVENQWQYQWEIWTILHLLQVFLQPCSGAKGW